MEFGSGIGPGAGTPTLGGDPVDQRFGPLEQTLENFQENSRQLGLIASDFHSKSQEPLNQRVHTLVSGLQELDQIKNQFADVKVPLEILDYLDEAKNPLLYTKECLQRTLNKNKEVKGKIELYTKFRAHLLKEWGEEMPGDALQYRTKRDKADQVPAVGVAAQQKLEEMDTGE